MKNGARNNSYQALCQKSMQVAANMIRLSSLSIAKLSLGMVGTPAPPRNSASATAPSAAPDEALLPQFHGGSSRSQVPECSFKPIIYLIAPSEGAGSSRVIRRERSVDGMAADYIQKVHDKNRFYSEET